MRKETKTSCENWNGRGKCSKGKQLEKMLDGLTKRLKVGRVMNTLKATRNRDASRSKLPLLKRTTPD